MADGSKLRAFVSVPDFLLRLAFFLIAPFFVAALAVFFPIGGALVNLALCLVVFFFAETVRERADRFPILGRLLRRQLAFDAYYRAHPPRPFLYYVFYPLLFPYWLVQRDARREFVLFKGYTLLALGILLGGSVWQYVTRWRPELGLRHFAKVLVVNLIVESVVVLTVLMPFSTTVIGYHLQGKHLRLGALLGAALLAVAFAVVGFARKRHELIPWPTGVRMSLRSQQAPRHSRAARETALRTAWAILKKGDAELVADEARETEVLGPPLDAAHGLLQRFYKDDEVLCFHLIIVTGKTQGRVLILYGDPYPASRPLVWLGLKANGLLVDESKDLPPSTFAIMKRATRR